MSEAAKCTPMTWLDVPKKRERAADSHSSSMVCCNVFPHALPAPNSSHSSHALHAVWSHAFSCRILLMPNHYIPTFYMPDSSLAFSMQLVVIVINAFWVSHCNWNREQSPFSCKDIPLFVIPLCVNRVWVSDCNWNREKSPFSCKDILVRFDLNGALFQLEFRLHCLDKFHQLGFVFWLPSSYV